MSISTLRALLPSVTFTRNHRRRLGLHASIRTLFEALASGAPWGPVRQERCQLEHELNSLKRAVAVAPDGQVMEASMGVLR